jgi:protein-arginine kinase activator protein McsA
MRKFIKKLLGLFWRMEDEPEVIREPETEFQTWSRAVAHLADRKTNWVFCQPGNDWETNKTGLPKKSPLEQDKEDLIKAIADERYEDAAKLRDKINSASSPS